MNGCSTASGASPRNRSRVQSDWDSFARHVSYLRGDFADKATYARLDAVLAELERCWQSPAYDHYLGKETVQNIPAFRFANPLFEPIWDRRNETLLWDVMQGDQTLFMREDQVEVAWQLLMPILDHWSGNPPQDFPNYPAGSWGPAAAPFFAADTPRGIEPDESPRH